MAITDFDKNKDLEITSVTGTPTIARALPFKITSGDDTTTGTGEIVLDWTNIASQADIGVYDESDVLLDYHFESFDATAETAVIWVYRSWVRDGSVQAQIAYGSGPSDQSVAASTVFDKESNLQAGYLLNESSGDALDVTSNNNDGTVTGATYSADGVVGPAYSFDGTDDYVGVDGFSSLGQETFSLIAWVYPSSDGTVVETNDGSGGQIGRIGYNTGALEFDFWNGSGRNTASVSVSADQWYRVVGFWDGSYNKIYLDGSLSDSSSETSFPETTDFVSLCAADIPDGGSNYFGGKIDTVLVLDTYPSEDWIQADYDASKSVPDFFSQLSLVVSTDAATSVGSDSATLNGTLENLLGNASLDVYFEYGTDTTYGNTTATQTISSVPTSFSEAISGLTDFTQYHYRAAATDGTDTWYGIDVSFYAADLRDLDETQSEFSTGTLTDVVADAGNYLRLDNTYVLSFDGTDDYVSTPLSDFAGEITIEGWLLSGFAVGNDGLNFVHIARATNTFLLVDGPDSYIYARIYVGGTEYNVSGGTVDSSKDNHIAMTYDGSALRAYLNDEEVGVNSNPSGDKDAQSDAFDLAGWDGSSGLDGRLADIRIWNIARTQSQIQNDMHSRLTGSETGLVAYYKIDEGTGTTATDSAGSNDGTINGASWTDLGYIHPFNDDGQGNRLSPQLDLSSLSTVDSSLIEWTETLNSQTITIETRVSLDGGSTWTSWQTATNGGSIPGLSSGDDVSNGLLESRQTLSTSDATVTPELHSLSLVIAEGTSGTSVTSDHAVLLAWADWLQGDHTAQIGFRSKLLTDNQTQAAWRLAVAGTDELAVAYGETAADNAVMPTAWRSNQVADETLHPAWQQQASADHPSLVAWPGQRDTLVDSPMAWLASTTTDAVIPVAWQGTTIIEADSRIPIEWLLARSADNGMILGWGQQRVANRNLPMAWGHLMDGDHSLLTAWAGNALADAAIPIAWAGTADTVDSDHPLLIAWLAQSDLADALIPVSWATLAQVDTGAHVSWMAQKALDQVVQAEWLSRSQGYLEIPLEWSQLTILEADTPLSIEWLSQQQASFDILVNWESELLFIPGVHVWKVDGRGTAWVVDSRGLVWAIEPRGNGWVLKGGSLAF